MRASGRMSGIRPSRRAKRLLTAGMLATMQAACASPTRVHSYHFDIDDSWQVVGFQVHARNNFLSRQLVDLRGARLVVAGPRSVSYPPAQPDAVPAASCTPTPIPPDGIAIVHAGERWSGTLCFVVDRTVLEHARSLRLVVNDALAMEVTGSDPAPEDLPPGVALLGPPRFRVEPLYPRAAAAQRAEGHVRLRLTIDRTGRVVHADIIESVPPGIFDQAAKRAAMQWRYAPEQAESSEARTTELKLTFALTH